MRNVIIKNWQLITITLLSVLITWPLFIPGYFSHHDDLQVMRVYEMRKCLEDFQIPCRWVPDMGYGNGFPLFNYYSVLPYYIGALLSFIFGFVVSAKILFLIPLLLGGISMYLLAKESFGDKQIALTVGIIYSFAPYRALDSYVRGAVAESFALAIIPLVFYLFLKLIREKSYKYFLGSSLSLAAFLLSHNIMTLLFLPLLLMWILLLTYKNFKILKIVMLSLALGFGLSSFFLLPAFLEKNLVEINTLTRFDLDFRVHFISIGQLFERSWGYGASVLGPNDSISFQIGLPLWILAALSVSWLVLSIIKRKDIRTVLIYLLFLASFLLSIFMMHNKSAFIWEKISLLHFAQFPWRFLSITIFSGSILAGFTFSILKGKLQKIILLLAVILTVFLNWSYFKPEKFYYTNDQQKLSGGDWETQQKAAIFDYLPKGAIDPQEAAPKNPIVLSGDVKIESFIRKSNYWEFNAKSDKSSEIEMPVFDFPNWEVYLDNKKIDHGKSELLKRIKFVIPKGEHKVTGYLQDTPIRTIGNLITLISLLILSSMMYGKSKKVFN